MKNPFRREAAPSRPPAARRIRELEIVTARLIRAGFAGDYHSAFHGRGIEFSQVREYQPGDDIRTIDWNVTARSGVPHVKEFIEERDLTVLLALDVSGSMGFGSLDRRKIDLALELAAVLSFSALQNRDRVGLITFSENVRDFAPPKRGRMAVQAIVRRAITASGRTSGAANVSMLADFIRQTHRRRAVIIFLSDFLGSDFERPLQRLAARHDVIALAIRDPRELRFPQQGIVSLVDAESGKRELVDLRKSRVLSRATADERSLASRFKAIGVDLLTLSTAVPYEHALLRFFRERVVRRR